jgi:hypothetical protein
MRRSIIALLGATMALAASTAAPAATKARCGAGGVKGIAWVTGGSKGVGTLTGTWTSAAAVFGYRWNCSGGVVSVRKPDTQPEGFDVRFAGNPGRVAVASAAGGSPGAASVSRNADGSFHVSVATGVDASTGAFKPRSDTAFIVIVF